MPRVSLYVQGKHSIIMGRWKREFNEQTAVLFILGTNREIPKHVEVIVKVGMQK